MELFARSSEFFIIHLRILLNHPNLIKTPNIHID